MTARWAGERIHWLTMPWGVPYGAVAPGDILARHRALEVVGDADGPGLLGSVMPEVAVLEHVGRVGARGVAELIAGGEGSQAVLGADLVEQHQHALFATGLPGCPGVGLADGRQEQESDAREEAQTDVPQTCFEDALELDAHDRQGLPGSRAV